MSRFISNKSETQLDEVERDGFVFVFLEQIFQFPV